MLDKNYYEALKKYNINTYGYDATAVVKALSAEMRMRFDLATDNMQELRDRAFVQACYSLFMQMKSVTSTGNLMLNDRSIKELQQNILNDWK